MLVALAGAAAGCLHVLSGPDHLTAVAPISLHTPKGAWRAGFRWGLGHSAGVIVVGLALLAVRGLVHLEKLSSFSDRLVGVVLIGIGGWTLLKVLRPAHRHGHGGHPHTHARAAFAIGALHGLSGSSHFFGVLPALALPTTWDAGTYMLGFAAGTVAAMSAFALCLGGLGRAVAGRMGLYRGLMGTAALGAMAVGTWWLSTPNHP